MSSPSVEDLAFQLKERFRSELGDRRSLPKGFADDVLGTESVEQAKQLISTVAALIPKSKERGPIIDRLQSRWPMSRKTFEAWYLANAATQQLIKSQGLESVATQMAQIMDGVEQLAHTVAADLEARGVHFFSAKDTEGAYQVLKEHEGLALGFIDAVKEHRRRIKEPWPTTVALRETVGWLVGQLGKRRGREYMDRCVEALGEGVSKKRAASVVRPVDLVVKNVFRSKGNGVSVEPDSFAIQGNQLAWVHDAWMDFEGSRYGQARIPASNTSNYVIRTLAKPPRGDVVRARGGFVKSDPSTWENADVRMVFPESKKGVQLAFDKGWFSYSELNSRIKEYLGTRAVHHFTSLLHMAGEQGADGKVCATWEMISDRLGYSGKRKTTLVAKQDAFRETLNLLKDVTLRVVKNPEDDKSEFRDDPLIRISGGEIDNKTGVINRFDVTFHPALYKSSHRGTDASDLYFVNMRARDCVWGGSKEDEFSLLTLLLIAIRTSGSKNDFRYVEMNAETLWGYASIRGGYVKSRKRWPRAKEQLDRKLNFLVSQGSIGGWGDESHKGCAAGPKEKYTVYTPQWLVDSLTHRVTPLLATVSPQVPRTGAELDAWLKQSGIGLRQLEETLRSQGYKRSKSSLSRDRKQKADLPAAMVEALGRCFANLPAHRGSSATDQPDG